MFVRVICQHIALAIIKHKNMSKSKIIFIHIHRNLMQWAEALDGHKGA